MALPSVPAGDLGGVRRRLRAEFHGPGRRPAGRARPDSGGG